VTQSVRLTLTESTIAGLFFIQRYRFLTIDQFARAGGLHHSTASEQLRQFQRLGVLGFFGNTRLPGNGKTPKAYFLTRKGYDLLRVEGGIPPDLLGGHKEVKVEAAWSPVMYHRLRTVDLLIALEVAIRKRAHLALVQTFLEYRRVKRGNQIVNETMDYVDSPESAENKIIPDGAFILENVQTKKRALFFLEMDMATERISTTSIFSQQTSLHRKFSQYDRYLKSFRYTKTYQEFGEFRLFLMLFVTLHETRITNIRRELQDLPEELSAYYRFTTFEEAMGDFLGAIWQSRSFSDTTRYPLVREEAAGSD
jgi:hypothetical protein